MLLLGNFNAKSKMWFVNDQLSSEETRLESLTSLYRMKQLISEPTHILEDTSSCIDLTFTNQPNLIMDSGVHPSLRSECHHQVIRKLIILQMQYPYICEVWDYLIGEKNTELILVGEKN